MLSCNPNTAIIIVVIATTVTVTSIVIIALLMSILNSKERSIKKIISIGATPFVVAIIATIVFTIIPGIHVRQIIIHGPIVEKIDENTAQIRDMEGTFTVHGIPEEHIDYVMEQEKQSDWCLHQDKTGKYHLCQEQ